MSDVTDEALVTARFTVTADAAPGLLPRVLEPFARVESAANRGIEGAGLGLPLTKRLVELHGGSVTASGMPWRRELS